MQEKHTKKRWEMGLESKGGVQYAETPLGRGILGRKRSNFHNTSLNLSQVSESSSCSFKPNMFRSKRRVLGSAGNKKLARWHPRIVKQAHLNIWCTLSFVVDWDEDEDLRVRELCEDLWFPPSLIERKKKTFDSRRYELVSSYFLFRFLLFDLLLLLLLFSISLLLLRWLVPLMVCVLWIAYSYAESSFVNKNELINEWMKNSTNGKWRLCENELWTSLYFGSMNVNL